MARNSGSTDKAGYTTAPDPRSAQRPPALREESIYGVSRVLFKLDAVQLSEAALRANPRSQDPRVFAFEDQCIRPPIDGDFELTLRVEAPMIDDLRVLQET